MNQYTPQIKFSHVYKKMPSGVQWCDTYIKGVKVIEYSSLTPEEIEIDTAIVGGGNYKLPTGKLIVIELWTDCLPEPKAWATMRSWDQEKERYYRRLLGQQVKIVIDK